MRVTALRVLRRCTLLRCGLSHLPDSLPCLRSSICGLAPAVRPRHGQHSQGSAAAVGAHASATCIRCWHQQRLCASAEISSSRHLQSRCLRSGTALQAVKKDAAALVKRISREDVDISFARSGGAGGQNVNKVNTKADIRLNIDKISWLEDDMKEALRKAEGNRFNKEGEIVVTSTRTRSQADNVEDAIGKLQSFLDDAALAVQPIEEDPVKKKKLLKQQKKANEKRLEAKKMKSQKKSDRRGKIDY